MASNWFGRPSTYIALAFAGLIGAALIPAGPPGQEAFHLSVGDHPLPFAVKSAPIPALALSSTGMTTASADHPDVATAAEASPSASTPKPAVTVATANPYATDEMAGPADTPPAAGATVPPSAPTTPNALPPDSVRVGSAAVNVRSGPYGSSPVLFVLQPGEDVSATDRQRGWVQIARANGESGWVYSSFLLNEPSAAPATASTPEPQVSSPANPAVTAGLPATPIAPRAIKSVSVSAGVPDQGPLQQVPVRYARLGGDMIVRAGPTDFSQPLFALPGGQRVAIAETRGSWVRIVVDGGSTGWIRTR